MEEIWVYIISLLPAIITGSVLFYVQRSQKKRDKIADERAKARERETYVMLELELAAAQLSYATAMAIKRGTPNGEIEEGIIQYDKALKGFREFEREQLSKL